MYYLKNLLLTRKGERPFQPEFGSDVYSLLFENMSESLDEELKETLSKDIKFWLPYIVIDNINIEIENTSKFLMGDRVFISMGVNTLSNIKNLVLLCYRISKLN